MPPFVLWTPGMSAGAPGDGEVATPITLPLGEMSVTVAVMSDDTGVTRTARVWRGSIARLNVSTASAEGRIWSDVPW